ncbi:MAG: hypothetical protein MUP76_10935 [Acidimicrobiia bacterium]|nr:hypothetical protein [Acidimicrobiia bacterium]
MDGQPPYNPEPPTGEPIEEPFPRFQTQEGFSSGRATGARPYRGGGQANPWLVGMAVAAILIAISVISFGLFAPDDDTQAVTTTTTTTAPTATTDPTATTQPGDTTSSTTGSAEITLPTTVAAGEITPTGDPIPVDELTMTSNDIGTLDFGDDGDQILGRLAATFGAPTQDTGFIIGDGTFGECPGDSIRVVQWGPLNVVILNDGATSTFVSYRMDIRYGGLTSATRDIATLSGLRVGDQVSQLEDIYGGFVIEYLVDSDVGLVFKLYSQRGGDLLLWGPVETQEPEGLVTGIYSPDSCGR